MSLLEVRCLALCLVVTADSFCLFLGFPTSPGQLPRTGSFRICRPHAIFQVSFWSSGGLVHLVSTSVAFWALQNKILPVGLEAKHKQFPVTLILIRCGVLTSAFLANSPRMPMPTVQESYFDNSALSLYPDTSKRHLAVEVPPDAQPCPFTPQ